MSARSINIDRMEQGYYTSIAKSINNLAYQQRIRKRIDINKDLQHQMQTRAELQRTGADDLVIAAVLQTIQDLKEERGMSVDYKRYVLTKIRTMLNHELHYENFLLDSMDNTEMQSG